jgi:cytochrome c oxidase assembly protein subunit 15
LVSESTSRTSDATDFGSTCSATTLILRGRRLSPDGKVRQAVRISVANRCDAPRLCGVCGAPRAAVSSAPMSPRAVRALAVSTLGFVLAVILWGAYVRASGAGAGCGAHWPVCNGSVVPRDPSTKTLIEYTHRVSSGIALGFVAALFWAARRAHPKGHTVRRAATAALVLMLCEAALGAGLVLLELVALDASARRAVAMSLHLTNTFLLLAALGTCTWHALVGPARARLQGGALLLSALAGFVLLGISGAIAALGDTLSQLGVRNAFVELLVGLRVAHPALALGELALLGAALGLLWTRRPDARGPVSWVAGLFLVQLCVGALNVALLAPVWMQMVHLLVADCVWLALVVVARVALTGPAPEPAPVGVEASIA